MNAHVLGHAMHIGIAEAGKIAALKGDHTEALRHYREALKLAQAAKAPEVFFRHYTQCVLESLELTGAHGDVIAFCDNALTHFDAIETPLAVHKRDHAAMLERSAVNLLKSGEVEKARAHLDRALNLVEPGSLPISEMALNWLRRGMGAQPQRLTDLQRKHGYFTVRKDQVDPSRATPLPTEHRGHATMSARM